MCIMTFSCCLWTNYKSLDINSLQADIWFRRTPSLLESPLLCNSKSGPTPLWLVFAPGERENRISGCGVAHEASGIRRRVPMPVNGRG